MGSLTSAPQNTALGLAQIIISHDDLSSGTLDAPWSVERCEWDIKMNTSSRTFGLARCEIKFMIPDTVLAGVLLPDRVSTPKKILLDLKIDGSDFFHGVLDTDNYSMHDYYQDGGALRFKYITYKFYDRVKILEEYTLSDASYTDGIEVATLLDNIAALLDLPALRTYFTYTVAEPGISHGIGSGDQELMIRGQDGTMNCLTWLTKAAFALGFRFYCAGGYFHIEDLEYASYFALDTTDDCHIERISNTDAVDYVQTSFNKDWNELSGDGFGYQLPNVTRFFGIGDPSASRNKNFEVNCTGITDWLYVGFPGGTQFYPDSTSIAPWEYHPDRIDDLYMPGLAFSSIHEGMLINFNVGSGGEPTPQFFSVATGNDTEGPTVYSNGATPDMIDQMLHWMAWRAPTISTTNYDRLYKPWLSTRLTCKKWAAMMLGNDKLKITGTANRPIWYRFSFAGKNYFTERVQYNFKSGSIVTNVKEVYIPTSQPENISGAVASAKSADTISDGNNSTTASELINHILNNDVHISSKGGGYSVLRMNALEILNEGEDDEEMQIRKVEVILRKRGSRYYFDFNPISGS